MGHEIGSRTGFPQAKIAKTQPKARQQDSPTQPSGRRPWAATPDPGARPRLYPEHPKSKKNVQIMPIA